MRQARASAGLTNACPANCAQGSAAGARAAGTDAALERLARAIASSEARSMVGRGQSSDLVPTLSRRRATATYTIVWRTVVPQDVLFAFCGDNAIVDDGLSRKAARWRTSATNSAECPCTESSACSPIYSAPLCVAEESQEGRGYERGEQPIGRAIDECGIPTSGRAVRRNT